MSNLDWFVLLTTIAAIVIYGLRSSRGSKDLDAYLRSSKDMKWSTIGLSIIATQASAITFLSAPGQAYDDGMRFAQLYFGVPLAMIILSITFVPLFHRLNVYTAYEFLEKRFDLKTRALGAILFLIQRGLAVGFTIYAPALILSNILGWNIYWTSIVIGTIVIGYTMAGGSKAVGRVHKQQMLVILIGMFLTGFIIVKSYPTDLGIGEAMVVADKMGKLNTIDWSFNISERYNIWSGLLGGFFLALSYFGTDQSQVQRYLGGRSIKAIKAGLLFNGIVKVPMQLSILFLGVLLFVFYQFEKPPIFFNEPQRLTVYNSEYALDLQYLESMHDDLFQQKQAKIGELLSAEENGNKLASQQATDQLLALESESKEVKREAVRLIAMNAPGTNTNDLDQIFITFVTTHLPKGLVGFLIAVIIMASMSSSSSILNALAGTSVIDVYKRMFKKGDGDSHYLRMSKLFTVFWGLVAVGFAIYANQVGNLIQAVNILGSIFYGTILGIFLVAFYFKRINGNAVFIAAIISQLLVILSFSLTDISFLWYNLIGCLLVIVISTILQLLFFRNEQRFTIKDYFSS